MTEREMLIRYKYDGKEPEAAALKADLERLTSGEPLDYVIGWSQFANVRLRLDSRPLIPRNETEYWCHNLIVELREKYDTNPFTLLDLCAGSGAIGLAVLKNLPNATVTFAELVPEHAELIRINAHENSIEESRMRVFVGDLFSALPAGSEHSFNVIATNPPYIPSGRTLDASVTQFEPATALYGGTDGLDLIRRIVADAPTYLAPHGSVWMECDISNIDAALELVEKTNPSFSHIQRDQYLRDRYIVAYYS